jgi:hypothetical protein
MMFWFLAAFERVGGDSGILFGTAIVNAACIGGALLIGYRRGGAVLTAWLAAFLAVLGHALGAAFLLDPWNPRLPVTGLVLFMLLAWSVACRDRAMWPWLVGVASWEIQAHVGFAAVVLAVTALVIGGRSLVLARARSPRSRSTGWRWAVVTGLVLWAAPIGQQLVGRRGNLEALVRFAVGRSEPTLGLRYSIHVAANQLSLSPPWATGHDTNALGLLAVAPLGAALVQLAVLGGVGWLAWRRGHTDAAIFSALALTAVAGGVFGLSRVVGIPFPYLARWMWIVAMFVPLATGWCLLELLRASAGVTSGAAGAAAIVAVALVAISTVEARMPALPSQPVSEATAGLLPAITRALNYRQAYLLVSSESDVVGPVLGPGLQAALERRGYHVSLPPEFAFQVGAWRTAPATGGLTQITIRSATDPTSAAPIPAAWTAIGHWDPLSAGQRRLATSLARSVRSRLGRDLPASSAIVAGPVLNDADYLAHGARMDGLRELARLQQLGQTYDVYLVAPAATVSAGG